MTDGVAPHAVTYDLRVPSAANPGFFTALEELSLTVLEHIEARAGALISDYASFVAKRGERPRSRGEYAVELLTLGMTWTRYAGAGRRSPRFAVLLCRWLYSLRRFRRLKGFVDGVRGKLAAAYLVPTMATPVAPWPSNLATFRHLIAWLTATGEFRLEVRRLRNWYAFAVSGGAARFDGIRDAALDCLGWFKREAEAALGSHTENVPSFLAETWPTYRGREDEIFCSKDALEYHMSMVASELMNRGLRNDFARTPQRIVLLPTCMRPANGKGCKAKKVDDDQQCQMCSDTCAIGRITALGRDQGFQTRLVPHSSSFTRWLLRWSASTESGVVAVACLPNIVPGGYEMRDLAIPSQCVPLDFSGCQKHWCREGVPTQVNETRLLQIVRQGQPKRPR